VAEIAPAQLPWLPLLAGIFEADVPTTPEVAALDERFTRIRLEEAVREVLGFAQARPTILLFEDAHWLDDASRHLLTALSEGIENRPWLLVVTRRPGAETIDLGASARHIELRPLDLGMSVTLADATADAEPLAPHVLSVLAERSGGNPLFLRELVAAARASASVEGLPDSVEGLLASQIDRLNPADRIVLRAASVIGSRFAADLVEEALGDGAQPLDPALWRRLEPFVVLDGDELRFRHALVRDAAYEGLPFRRRRELHGRIGDTIASRAGDRADDAAEALSLHFFAAGRMRDAWTYSCVAAKRAKAVYANVEAATFYERALRAAAAVRGIDAHELAEVAEALGDVRFRLGEFARATDAYRRARARADDDPAEQARLMLKEAFVPWRAGRYAPTLRWITRGLKALEGAEGDAAAAQRARLLTWHAVVRQKQGRSTQALVLCRRAIEEAEAAGARDALAHAYYVLDWALVSLGRFDDAVYSPKALALYRELADLGGQAAVLNNMGFAAYFRGRWDEALAHYDGARAAWEKIGDRWAAAYPTANRGEILSDQGRLDEAEALFRSALRVLRASGQSSLAPDVLSHLGRLAARRGQFEEAHAMFDLAREAFAAAREHADVLVTDLRRADCLLLDGRGGDALDAVDAIAARPAATAAAGVLEPILLRVRGWALVETGRRDEGRAELERALDAGRRLSADAEVALTLQALERLAREDGDDASPFARDREAIVRRLGILASPAYPRFARE
jgi:tetratricopeptide (TPR) repeat protein